MLYLRDDAKRSVPQSQRPHNPGGHLLTSEGESLQKPSAAQRARLPFLPKAKDVGVNSFPKRLQDSKLKPLTSPAPPDQS